MCHIRTGYFDLFYTFLNCFFMVELKISVRCCMSSGIEHNIKSMKGLRISVKKKKGKKSFVAKLRGVKLPP